MKKQSFSRISNVISSVINLRAWIDYDRMKSFTLYLLNGVKKMLIPQPRTKINAAESKKAFNVEVANLHLTEDDLKEKSKGLYRLSLLMCAIAIGLFIYAIYHVIYGSLPAFLISIVLALISVVLAFRYHFWYFQIKERKLGCSIQEWYRHGLLGEK